MVSDHSSIIIDKDNFFESPVTLSSLSLFLLFWFVVHFTHKCPLSQDIVLRPFLLYLTKRAKEVEKIQNVRWHANLLYVFITPMILQFYDMFCDVQKKKKIL